MVEIGPGLGDLTEVLARQLRVTAIEKDSLLAERVRERMPEVRVITADALEVDWREAAGLGPADPLLVAGNIPYNITSPLIAKALEPPRPIRIVFLVQQEVAERLAAAPGTREYGALSVGVQSVARVERLFRVPAGAFRPAPRVESAVVRITPCPNPLVRDDEVGGFRRMVVGLFGFRRKQLGRGIRELTGWSAERVEQARGREGERARGREGEMTRRPETLAPEEFVELYRALIDGGWRPE